MPRANNQAKEIEILKKKVANLDKRLSKVESKTKKQKKNNNGLRILGIVLASGLAGAILVVANIVFFSARTIVETDKYTARIASVIEQPAVQQAIADKTTEVVFSKVDTEALLAEALPPKAQFAAPTLSSQLQTFTNQKTKELVANPDFQSTWVSVNEKAHSRFIEGVRNYEGDGTIDVSDIYSRVVQNLGDSKLSFLQDVKLPEKIGSVQVVDAAWLPKAHWLVNNLDNVRLVTFILFVLLSVAVVFLAKNRQKATARLGILYASLMLATLVALRIVRQFTIDEVDPKYQQAALETWQALAEPFVLQTVGIMVLGIAIAFVAWAFGPSSLALRLRNSFEQLSEGKIHQAIFGKKENGFTKWVRRNQTVLIAASFVVIAIWLLFVSITVANILWALVGLAVLLATVNISSAKR